MLGLPLTILLACIGLASCAAPQMQLTVSCNDRLVIAADITPGVTEMSGVTWHESWGPAGDARVACRADLRPKRTAP